jgi:hypothetical protein
MVRAGDYEHRDGAGVVGGAVDEHLAISVNGRGLDGVLVVVEADDGYLGDGPLLRPEGWILTPAG